VCLTVARNLQHVYVVIQQIPPKLSEALVANLETIDNGRGRMLYRIYSFERRGAL
jgi:hypothetical protein